MDDKKYTYFISIEQDLFSGFPLYFFRPPFNINIIDTNFENHHFRIYDNYNNYSIIRSSHLSYNTVIMIEFAYLNSFLNKVILIFIKKSLTNQLFSVNFRVENR